jgi:thiamine-phosphate pyrophosphorylase
MMNDKRIRRIIDVNLNRSCEGLRVLEDIARFACNNRTLSRRLKEMRHAVRELFADEVVGATRSRDVRGDVGKAPSGTEERRADVRSLAAHNAKRAEEGLRSLEEVSKLHSRERARRIKRMRFELYGLEKNLLEILASGKGLKGTGLYVVLPDSSERTIVHLARKLVDAPVAVIQLRCKTISDARLFSIAKRIRALTASHGIQFIVNDRVDIALAAGADGVHIGQDDMPIAAIRKVTDFSFTVGVSTHSIPEAVKAEKEGADYIAFGSIFPTRSKADARVQGIERLRRLHTRISIPIVAIGGITDSNASQISDAGAQFAAVISYLSDARDPLKAAKKLSRVFKSRRRKKTRKG